MKDRLSTVGHYLIIGGMCFGGGALAGIGSPAGAGFVGFLLVLYLFTDGRHHL